MHALGLQSTHKFYKTPTSFGAETPSSGSHKQKGVKELTQQSLSQDGA